MCIFNVRVTEDATKRVIVKALNSFDIITRQKIYTKGASDFKPNTGIEVLSNGNFAVDSSGWILGSGWVWSNGAIAVTSGDTVGLRQSGVVTIGRKYTVTLKISDYSLGIIIPRVGATGIGAARSGNGTFSESIIAAGDTKFYIYGGTGGNLPTLTVDSISCVEDSLSNQTVSIGAQKDVDISTMFSDPDVDNRELGIIDKLVITASSDNADQCGASVYEDSSGNTQLRLVGYAAGTPTITLTATDLHGNSVTQTMVVTVS